MGVLPTLTDSLWKAHRRLQTINTPPSEQMMELLASLGQSGFLDAEYLTELATDVARLQQALVRPMPGLLLSSSSPPPQSLYNVQTFCRTSSADEAERLAVSLWQTYGHQSGWLSIFVDNVTAAVAFLPPSHPGSLVELYVSGHQLAAHGLESVLLIWLSSRTSAGPSNPFSGPSAYSFATFLRQLVIRRVLNVRCLLDAFIVPLLQNLAQTSEFDMHVLQIIKETTGVLRFLFGTQSNATTPQCDLQARLTPLWDLTSFPKTLHFLSQLTSLASILKLRGEVVLADSAISARSAMVGMDSFKIAFLRDVNFASEILLPVSNSSVSTLGDIDTLSAIISGLKTHDFDTAADEYGRTSPNLRNKPDQTRSNLRFSRSSIRNNTPSSHIWRNDITRVELRVYLRRLELIEDSTSATKESEFAAHFLESLLTEPDTSITQGQLRAFNGNGLHQVCKASVYCLVQNLMKLAKLVQAAFSNIQCELDRLNTSALDAEKDVRDFRRYLRQILSVLRLLLQQLKVTTGLSASNHEIASAEAVDGFVKSWYTGLKNLTADTSSSESTTLRNMMLMFELACLALRWVDMWNEHQTELQETLSLMLRQARIQVCASIAAEEGCRLTQLCTIAIIQPYDRHLLLDVISYFLDCKAQIRAF